MNLRQALGPVYLLLVDLFIYLSTKAPTDVST